MDWGKPESLISRHFSVHEALWLPGWSKEATAAEGLNDHVKKQIVRLAEKLDVVRDRIGVHILVHNWYRPEAYNHYVHGAPQSAHMCALDWSAVDWSAALPGTKTRGESCDKLRAMILPWLQELDLRMENNGDGATWIHLDTKPLVLQRYFRP